MSTDNFTELIRKFTYFTRKPVNFLCIQENIESDVKNLIKSMYDYTKLEEKNVIEIDSNANNGALPELIVNDFDEEQIWQEIEMQNSARWNTFIEDVSYCVGSKQNLHFPIEYKKKDDKVVDQNEMISNTNENESKNVKKKSSRKQKLGVKRVTKHGRGSMVDDDFFNLKDMEKFLDTEDKKATQNGGNKKIGSDEESIDLFDDAVDDMSEEENLSDAEIKYSDFFDGPEDDTSALQSDVESENGESSNEVDEEELNDKDSVDEKKKQKSVRFNIDDSESDNEKSNDDSGSNAHSKSDSLQKLSEYELRQKRLRQKIEKLEEKNLAEKPWQLKGEVDASTRPQNSLLEQVVDFDLTTRPVPIITEETTYKLEDVIKQRIKDRVWDDVERKSKPVQEPREFKKNVILDQEKSKVSLAHVYEQEYLKQGQNANGTEVVEEEPKEHKEIKLAMDSLFAKLDALSNYHYTPKVVQPEIKIISNIPAISMEEVAPVATSEAALLAPEEIKAKHNGELMSKDERTNTDKKRERRRKKQHQREKEKAKQKQQKLLEKLKPGLANKYSKEKAIKMLQKVTTDFSNTEKMVQLSDKTSLKSSKAFFTQLNDDVAGTGNSKLKKKKAVLSAKKYKL